MLPDGYREKVDGEEEEAREDYDIEVFAEMLERAWEEFYRDIVDDMRVVKVIRGHPPSSTRGVRQ